MHSCIKTLDLFRGQKALPPLPTIDQIHTDNQSPPAAHQKEPAMHTTPTSPGTHNTPTSPGTPNKPSPLQSSTPISLTQLKEVKLKHVVRSQSTCDKTDYDNWSQENEIALANNTRRISICEASEYAEIPADIDAFPKYGQRPQQVSSTREWSDRILPVHQEEPLKHVAIDKPKGRQDSDKEDDSGYMRVGDVPRDFKGITIRGVGSCLRLLNLNKYVDKFAEGMVDGQLLLALDQNAYREDFGMSHLEAVRLHQFVHEGWRPK